MLRYPFNGVAILTNSYRADPRNQHLGEDYGMANRTAIIAMTAGIIIKAEGDISKKTNGIKNWIANTKTDPFIKRLGKLIYERPLRTEDYGNYVKIDHGNNVSTLCAHLDEVVVSVGQKVKEGQLIGYSDSTGNSTGGHCHCEVRVRDKVIDPSKFDYSFNGIGGVSSEELNPMDGLVTIIVDTLTVHHGPNSHEKQSGSREVHKGDKVEVSDWVHGEKIQDNDIWYKSIYGNYFWSGGTDMKGLPTKEKEKDMTQEEHDQKVAELEARRTSIEARRVELEGAVAANIKDADIFKADWEAFASTAVESYAVAEQPLEAVVETPVESVETVAEEVAPEKEEAKSLVEKLLAQAEELKVKFGL